MRKLKLDREGREWHLSYHKDDGFTLHIYETSLFGEAFEHVFLALTDHDHGIKIGRWRTPPFCWISPWEWVHKIGVWDLTITWSVLDREGNETQRSKTFEDANLGSLWWKTGQRVCGWLDDLRRERELFKVPLTNEQVREHFPTTWADLSFLVEDVDEEGDTP